MHLAQESEKQEEDHVEGKTDAAIHPPGEPTHKWQRTWTWASSGILALTFRKSQSTINPAPKAPSEFHTKCLSWPRLTGNVQETESVKQLSWGRKTHYEPSIWLKIRFITFLCPLLQISAFPAACCVLGYAITIYLVSQSKNSCGTAAFFPHQPYAHLLMTHPLVTKPSNINSFIFLIFIFFLKSHSHVLSGPHTINTGLNAFCSISPLYSSSM